MGLIFKTMYSKEALRLFKGGICTLYIPDEDKMVSVASDHLEPVTPKTGDRVRPLVFQHFILEDSLVRLYYQFIIFVTFVDSFFLVVAMASNYCLALIF